MDHPLIDLINARIKAAEQGGAFDNLPGAGQPQPPCDDPENAVLNRILKDNGALPEGAALARDLSHLRAQLNDCADRSTRQKLIQDIALLQTRIDIARKRG